MVHGGWVLGLYLPPALNGVFCVGTRGSGEAQPAKNELSLGREYGEVHQNAHAWPGQDFEHGGCL